MNIKLLQRALTQYLHKPPSYPSDRLTAEFIKEQTHKPGCSVIVHGTSLIEENNKPNDLDILIFTQREDAEVFCKELHRIGQDIQRSRYAPFIKVPEAGRLKVGDLHLIIEISLCLIKVQEYAFNYSVSISKT